MLGVSNLSRSFGERSDASLHPLVRGVHAHSNSEAWIIRTTGPPELPMPQHKASPHRRRPVAHALSILLGTCRPICHAPNEGPLVEGRVGDLIELLWRRARAPTVGRVVQRGQREAHARGVIGAGRRHEPHTDYLLLPVLGCSKRTLTGTEATRDGICSKPVLVASSTHCRERHFPDFSWECPRCPLDFVNHVHSVADLTKPSASAKFLVEAP